MSLNGCIDKILLNCRFGNPVQISEQKKGVFRMTMIIHLIADIPF